MSKTATATILFGSYTNKNTNTNTVVSAPSLTLESQMANELSAFRASLGLTSVRNVYPWWTYTLAALTYFPKGYSSLIDIDAFLQDANIHVRNITKYSTLLNNSIDGQAPSKVAREYTGKLPKMVRMLKLKSERMTTNHYGRGRKPIGFSYVDPVAARATLLAQYPDTLHLFEQLDYFVKGN
jgi:hypothetical protein